MKTLYFLVLFIGFHTNHLLAQDLTLFEKKVFIQKNDTLLYRLLLPESFSSSSKYPLVVFLHGSGERGADNEKQLIHGAKLFLSDTVRKDYPAIVVFPQCGENTSWVNVQSTYDSSGKRTFFFAKESDPTVAMQLLERLVKDLTDHYPVDRKRIYVGGLSMGAMGAFELVRRNPLTFAAAFPICGGANPLIASKLNKTAWWIFHGAKDDVVPPLYSEQMVKALREKKAEVLFRLYPQASHNSWDAAFAEKDLLPWLFSHHK